MKWLVFPLILSGCGELDHFKNTTAYVLHHENVDYYCKVAKYTSCGMTLEKCENNATILCAHNVEMKVIK